MSRAEVTAPADMPISMPEAEYLDTSRASTEPALPSRAHTFNLQPIDADPTDDVDTQTILGFTPLRSLLTWPPAPRRRPLPLQPHHNGTRRALRHGPSSFEESFVVQKRRHPELEAEVKAEEPDAEPRSKRPRMHSPEGAYPLRRLRVSSKAPMSIHQRRLAYTYMRSADSARTDRLLNIPDVKAEDEDEDEDGIPHAGPSYEHPTFEGEHALAPVSSVPPWARIRDLPPTPPLRTDVPRPSSPPRETPRLRRAEPEPGPLYPFPGHRWVGARFEPVGEDKVSLPCAEPTEEVQHVWCTSPPRWLRACRSRLAARRSASPPAQPHASLPAEAHASPLLAPARASPPGCAPDTQGVRAADVAGEGEVLSKLCHENRGAVQLAPIRRRRRNPAKKTKTKNAQVAAAKRMTALKHTPRARIVVVVPSVSAPPATATSVTETLAEKPLRRSARLRTKLTSVSAK